ncbi:MAG: glkA2 [Frankiales bacterium]|nr:glkA2 [Frankiales bacterium]
MSACGVLEVGGTHVCAAVVDPDRREVLTHERDDLDSNGSRDDLLDVLRGAAARLPVPVSAVALPGPFDYAAGVALYEGVGTFDALRGVDLRLALGLPDVVFLNDADAFALGVAPATGRCVVITLGTGVGSGWVADGRLVTSGCDVPPEGSAHLLTYDGRHLEETVSRRAIRAAYGQDGTDVREIAERARSGEQRANDVLEHAMRALGQTLGPWLAAFRADEVVIGGSISRSWDLLGPWFEAAAVTRSRAVVADDAALLGAALFAATDPAR